MQLHFDGFALFLPIIFPTEETLALWPSLKVLHLLELILIIAMCPAIVLLVYALENAAQHFHRNLRRIAQVHFLAFTISQITRIFILLFEEGFWNRRDPFDGRVYALVCIRYTLLCYLVTIIPAVVVERALASHYISNYESVRRRWISFSINMSSMLISTVYNALIQLIAFSVYAMLLLIIIAIVIYTFSSLVMMMVYRRDAAKLRDLSNQTGRSTINYTLSMKFQLAENVRVAKLLTQAAVGLSIWAMGICCLCSPPFVIIGEEKPISQILYAISNVVIALSLTVTVWLSLVAIGELNRIYVHSHKYLCCLNRKVKQTLIYPATAVDTQTKADKYFIQLQTTWRTIP